MHKLYTFQEMIGGHPALGAVAIYKADEVDAELAQLRSENSAMIEGAYYRTLEKAQAVPQPPVLSPTPPSHEASYANNLAAALESCRFYENAAERLTKERDALRNTLVALAPDLKVMAILYQQQGQSQRAQALMAIRESLGLGQ